MKNIVILGAGGNCIDILDTLNDLNKKNSAQYHCAGFLDDNADLLGTTLHGVEILGPLNHASSFEDCLFVNGIGSENNFWLKRVIIEKTGIEDRMFETIIHPSASVSDLADLGAGTVIFQNVTITSNVSIGKHVIVLPNSIVSHDSILGDYTCVAGGVCVSGGVTVGHSCYLGTNSSIRGNVRVGDLCLIGMGSVVLEDVPDNQVMTGVPARRLRNTT